MNHSSFINKFDPHVPLTQQEIQTSLRMLFNRMDSIQEQCSDRFPLYSIARQNKWRTSTSGSWLGGFWTGCWWLRARITQSESSLKTAIMHSHNLKEKLEANTVNRAMIFWYGAALGALWFDDKNAHRLANSAAESLLNSYRKPLDCIPLGPDIGGGVNGNEKITIDTLSPLIQLLNYTHTKKGQYVAQLHTKTLISTLIKHSGASHSDAHYSDSSLTPVDIPGNWSRGQAWAMLGLSRAAYLWGEPYIQQAQATSHYWQKSRQLDKFPLDLLNRPEGLYDPSSLVISSMAMLLLNTLTIDDHWLILAKEQLAMVVRSSYFSCQETDKHGEQALFWGCCATTNQAGNRQLVESTWGLFFLISSLATLSDIIPVSDT